MTATATALDDRRLLRPRDAAAALGIPLRQLDRLVDDGLLSPIRLVRNGNRTFRMSDRRAFVEAAAATEKED